VLEDTNVSTSSFVPLDAVAISARNQEACFQAAERFLVLSALLRGLLIEWFLLFKSSWKFYGAFHVPECPKLLGVDIQLERFFRHRSKLFAMDRRERNGFF
jgi:hypothetical protein